MRTFLPLALAVAALASIPVAQATLSPRDTRAVQAAVASSQALETTLRSMRTGATQKVRKQLASCPGIQPSGQEKQQRLSKLILLETARELQRRGRDDYAAFVKQVQALRFTDSRLRVAQAALAGTLRDLRKQNRVPLDPCADEKAFARAGYSAAGLKSWAQEIDRRAGVSEDASALASKHVRASRPALLAAGLTPAAADQLLDSETGDVFVLALVQAA